MFMLARQPFSEKWELGSHGLLRIIKSRQSWRVCPVSSHLGLSSAEQAGPHEACARLCLEFFLLTLSQGIEKSITF